MKRWQLVLIGFGALGLSGSAALAEITYWYTVAIAASHNATEQVQALLVQGATDADAIDSTSGRTALDFAASFNNVAMAKILLDHGAHVDGRDTSGNTALHWAAERGNLEVMRALIDSKASVDATNRQGVTPLMSAAGHAQAGAIRLLVASGADRKKQDFTGRDAQAWAAGKAAVLQALNAAR